MTAIIFCFTTANAQLKLDDKNGFNKFTLGSTLKEVKKIATLKKVKVNNVPKDIVYFDVTPLNEYQIFEYGLRDLQLIFYKDELLQIDVYLETSKKAGFISIDVGMRIAKEYGDWIDMTLGPKEHAENLLSKSRIVSEKVTLLRTVYGYVTSRNQFEFKGDRYSFVSNPIYNKMKSMEGNGL